MKTPTWAMIVGICMLLFGANYAFSRFTETSGLLEKSQESMKEAEDQMSKTFSRLDSLREIPKDSLTAKQAESLQEVEMVKSFLGDGKFGLTMEEIETTRFFGKLGLAVVVLYLIAGVLLLMKKRRAPLIAMVALVLMICLEIWKAMSFNSLPEQSVIMKFAVFGFYFSILLDVVLLIVTAMGDKTAYQEQGALGDWST